MVGNEESFTVFDTKMAGILNAEQQLDIGFHYTKHVKVTPTNFINDMMNAEVDLNGREIVLIDGIEHTFGVLLDLSQLPKNFQKPGNT